VKCTPARLSDGDIRAVIRKRPFSPIRETSSVDMCCGVLYRESGH
jgi:hypothetical protein